MRFAVMTLLVAAMCWGLLACGGGPAEEEPAGAGVETAEPEPEETTDESAASDSAEPVATETEVGEAEGLADTTWEWEEFTATFHTPPDVHVSGGPLGAAGADGEYELSDDGSIEVNVMGQTYTGTYENGELVVDGIEATLLEQ